MLPIIYLYMRNLYPNKVAQNKRWLSVQKMTQLSNFTEEISISLLGARYSAKTIHPVIEVKAVP